MSHISALHCYPVKSCTGHALQRAELTPRGIRYDREWMVVDAEGVFISQRTYPAISQILPAVENGRMTLSAPGMPDLAIDTPDKGDIRRVVVWNDVCEAIDQGEEAARWLGDYLETTVRLVRMSRSFARIVDQTYAPRATDQVGFADGYPMLLISEASLADLNTRLSTPIPMNRFRPNLVVTGCAPYAEDDWGNIRIGGLMLEIVKPCGRCATTTVDQATGIKDPDQEPLRTLSTYRRWKNLAIFGQNVTCAETGVLSVGDIVETG
ncbi:MAG: MOSC domain-containing protein [candidate division Zixibacteria bacterium]|nr:MOSC domain-containing protein [candidate division Zixibacteria bacterium]